MLLESNKVTLSYRACTCREVRGTRAIKSKCVCNSAPKTSELIIVAILRCLSTEFAHLIKSQDSSTNVSAVCIPFLTSAAISGKVCWNSTPTMDELCSFSLL
jgi:hypothetical protein